MTDLETKHIAAIRRQWHNARNIRYAGKCDACKRLSLYSYQLPVGDKGNAERERVWFSPHCLPETANQPALF